MAAKGSLTKHGFPRGYRFVPTPLELISLLTDHIHGAPLPPPLHAIFHDLSILDYHPGELYERFKGDAEHRYIYFFSWRQFQKPGTAGGVVTVPEDRDQKEPRPVRVARGGGWKPSGGGQVLHWPKRMGGLVAGRMVTMVFYDRVGGNAVKSNWGMHELIVPVDRSLTSLPSKYTRFYDLALYRLYILKSGDMENESSSSTQIMPFHPFSPSTSMAPCPPIHPCGIFTGKQHPLAAGASSSQMPPPQQQLPSSDYTQYYHQQQQHAFGATAAGVAVAQHQVRTMPLLSAGNSCQFALTPAPVTAPPDAADPAAHHPATTCSPPAIESPTAAQNATVTTEPAHAQLTYCVKPKEEEKEAPPAVEDVASSRRWRTAPPAAAAHQPSVAATQRAGQEAGHSGGTCSPPATGSPTAEEDATATTEPAHVFAAQPKEEEGAPLLEGGAPATKDEGMGDELGNPDWSSLDLTPLDDSFFMDFTMDEILRCFDDYPAEGDNNNNSGAPAVEGDNNNSGGENCSKAGGSQQEPPAALSCY